MEPFLGQITAFGFNFAPNGWALCNGQTLPIQQYTALFSLLGTMYGGNGTSNFMLPNLQMNVPVGVGQLTGGENYSIGAGGGSSSVVLTTQVVPSHNHSLSATTATGSAPAPAGELLAVSTKKSATLDEQGLIYNVAAPTTSLAPASVAPAGGSQQHNNTQPTLVVNYCIALTGIFPSRP
jgi:microcystin-dependent protein